MTGLMMPLISPTTTSERSACAAAVPNTKAAATVFKSSSASTPRIDLDGCELARDGLDVGSQAQASRVVGRVFGDRANDLGDPLHVALGRPACGDRRCPEADATGHRWAARFARHGRHAGDDAGALERARQDLARILP